MKHLFIILLLLSLNPIKACECVEVEYSGKHVRQFFHWYEKVFIGNLIENKEGEYKFEVIKGFKNCEFRDTVWGKYNNSCSITPKEKGLWIVYASIQDSTNNEIDIDACNSTRNLKSNQQYLYNGYDINSESYKLKEEQAGKLIEFSILEELNKKENITIASKEIEERILTKLTESKKGSNPDWIYLCAIGLSIIAILMNLQTRMKKTVNNNNR